MECLRQPFPYPYYLRSYSSRHSPLLTSAAAKLKQNLARNLVCLSPRKTRHIIDQNQGPSITRHSPSIFLYRQTFFCSSRCCGPRVAHGSNDVRDLHTSPSSVQSFQVSLFCLSSSAKLQHWKPFSEQEVAYASNWTEVLPCLLYFGRSGQLTECIRSA